MDRVIIILLESSVALILFYLVFAIWLKRETNFRENRFFLIASAVISLIIPWINLTLPLKSSDTLILYNVIDTINITATGYEQKIVHQLNTAQWLLLTYVTGVILMLFWFVIKMYRITRIDKGSQNAFSDGFYKNVRFINADVVPFSFLRKIYINPDTISNDQLADIIAHESVHINQQHTYDNLFYELLIVFFWFNPIVYQYRKSAKEVHEFLADQGAIQSGVSGVKYQKLLFEQATGLKLVHLANSFNYSLIKRRLVMLTKIKSSKLSRIRVLYVLPVLLGVLLVFACNQGENAFENSEKSVVINDLTVYDSVEVMPQFPGGVMELKKFISQNVKYPAEAANEGIEGKVFVQFVVNQEGGIEQVKVTRGVDPALDAEAVRVISSQPKWTPGENSGHKVKVQFTIPISFKLDTQKELGENMVFFKVEKMPKFPGGDEAIKKYINDHVKYPDAAKKAGIAGRVFVQFVVDTDGSVIDPKIIRGVDADLNNEALRVISGLPKWEPGSQRGVLVKVAFTVPINFQLN